MSTVRNCITALAMCSMAAIASATTVAGPDDNGSLARGTIADDLLEWEGRYLATPPAMHELLDEVIRDTEAELHTAELPTDQTERAKATLSIIERVLLRHNFVYPARDYVGPLHDAMTATSYDAAGRILLEGRDNNHLRGKMVEGADDKTQFHVADCDLYSLLYVSIGQALKLPITMVDMPSQMGVGHDYVAWVMPDGKWLAWEAMNGEVRDRELRAPNPEVRSGRPMSLAEVRGYAHWMALLAARRATNYAGEIEEARAGLALWPSSPELLNDLAWTLATCPDPTLRDPKAAAAIAARMDAAVLDAETLDTMATAYAASGSWARAQQLQNRAVALLKRYRVDNEKIIVRKERFAKCQIWIEPRENEARLAPDAETENALPNLCGPVD